MKTARLKKELRNEIVKCIQRECSLNTETLLEISNIVDNIVDKYTINIINKYTIKK